MRASNDHQQVRDSAAAAGALAPGELAADLYALVVYLHKNCNADLFEAVGALELTLTQIKLLHHLEDAEQRADAQGGRRARARLAAGGQPDGR